MLHYQQKNPKFTENCPNSIWELLDVLKGSEGVSDVSERAKRLLKIVAPDN